MSPDTESSSVVRNAAIRSEVTRRLWAYIKKNGLAGRNAQRQLFDTPVPLRHLKAADIAKMVSDAKVKVG